MTVDGYWKITTMKNAMHERFSDTLMGMPATGKTYDISETHIVRIRDGQVVEHWRDGDTLGLMQQLGALPAPGGQPAPEPAAAGSTGR